MRFDFPLLQFLSVTYLLFNSAFAHCSQNNNILLTKSNSRPLITLSLGPDFITQGRAQTLSLYPPFENYYTNTKRSTSAFDGGVFLGVERSMTNETLLQLGVGGYTDELIHPKGDVWLFGSSLFDTLAYQYHVRHSRVVAESKLLFNLKDIQLLHPYFSGTLGAAFNQAGDYQETRLVAGAVPTQPFNNHTRTMLTWGFGVGVDASLSKNVRLGMGYQFADLGSVALGPTPAALTSQTLSFPHLYTNQIRFQLSLLK